MSMIERSRLVGPSMTKNRFEVLTGLRGVSILWVVFTHLPLTMPHYLEVARETWGIGVDMFFAISGFLVTRSLFECDALAAGRGRGAGFAAREFLVRRVSRIFPAYYLTLAVIAVMGVAVDRSLLARLTSVAEQLPSFPLFYSNYILPGVRNSVPEVLAVAWSISFQEQFYLVLVSLYLASRKYLPHLILGAGLFSLFARFYMIFFGWQGGSHTAELQMWLHLRFDAIAWSCLAWVHYDRLSALWATPTRARIANGAIFAALVSVLVSHMIFHGDLNQAIIYCFKGPILALVVRAMAELSTQRERGLFAMFLAHPLIGKVGVVAFEIYLVNAIVMAALLRFRVQNYWLFIPLAYAITVIGGWSFYQVFGRPAKGKVRAILSPGLPAGE